MLRQIDGVNMSPREQDRQLSKIGASENAAFYQWVIFQNVYQEIHMAARSQIHHFTEEHFTYLCTNTNAFTTMLLWSQCFTNSIWQLYYYIPIFLLLGGLCQESLHHFLLQPISPVVSVRFTDSEMTGNMSDSEYNKIMSVAVPLGQKSLPLEYASR